jgi:hypothetical protein
MTRESCRTAIDAIFDSPHALLRAQVAASLKRLHAAR